MQIQRIGFIGAGNMGGALAAAVCGVLPPETVFLADASAEKAAALAEKLGCGVTDTDGIIAGCDCVFLGVKPQVLPDVLHDIRDRLQMRPQTLFISMAAGVPLAAIEEMLGTAAVIRIMPNLAVNAGEGMLLYTANAAVTAAQEADFLQMLSAAGEIDKLDEKLMDAASAISGCGPAFVSMFIAALADGGVACGLPREKAQQYAIQTAIGTAALLKASGQQPAALTRAVCSPAGSTIEGVHALENADFAKITAAAVAASYRRTKELGKS